MERLEVKTETGITLCSGYTDGDKVVLTYRGDYEVMYGNGKCYEKFSSVEAVMRLSPTAARIYRNPV